MKFPQILMLLTLFSIFVCSCRQTDSKDTNNPKPENTIPSTEYHRNDPATPRKTYPSPTKESKDSIFEKRSKSKDLDTLIPRVALLG